MDLLKPFKRDGGQQPTLAGRGEAVFSRFRHEVDQAIERAWEAMERGPWSALAM